MYAHSLSLRRLSLSLLLLLPAAVQAVEYSCFWPDGSLAQENYVSCNATEDALAQGTACCSSNDACTTEGWCLGSGGFPYRGGCTNANWTSPACQTDHCYSATQQAGQYLQLASCGDAAWCCLAGGLNIGACCENNFTLNYSPVSGFTGLAFIPLARAQAEVELALGNTSTTPTANSTCSANSTSNDTIPASTAIVKSNSSGVSTGALAGGVVGGVVGGLLIGALAGFFIGKRGLRTSSVAAAANGTNDFNDPSKGQQPMGQYNYAGPTAYSPNQQPNEVKPPQTQSSGTFTPQQVQSPYSSHASPYSPQTMVASAPGGNVPAEVHANQQPFEVQG